MNCKIYLSHLRQKRCIRLVFDGDYSFIRSFSVRIVAVIIFKVYPPHTISGFQQTQAEVLIKLTSIFLCMHQLATSFGIGISSSLITGIFCFRIEFRN